MTTARSAYRAAIGKRCGRGLYVASTTTGTSTTSQIVDSARTEFPKAFDGAQIYFASATAPKVALIKGGSEGRLFLDTALGSIPASGAAYEIFKGLTLDDYNDAIDFAHADAYPSQYLAINSFATEETTGTSIYALAEAWRSITQVRREIDGSSSPVQYEVLSEGNDYFIRMGTAGLVYEANYTTKTGIALHFQGKGILTIDTTDASTSVAPLQLIVHGALHYLYSKGSNADELALGQKFDKKAQEHLALFEQAKMTYRMRPQRITASLPRVDITNDGSSARETF